MADNLSFFENNVSFYSAGYRDFALRKWEEKIVNSVSGKVLDVACGGGRITVPMLEKGCDVIGTDFVKEFENKIRQHESRFKGNFKFIVSEMDDLTFPDDTFDCVTCINSIIYMKTKARVYQSFYEMARVLKPNGKLYITLWNMLNPLWGTSILANYLLNGCKRFGETSPFLKMDTRARKQKVEMYVPTKYTLNEILEDASIKGSVMTAPEFLESESFLSLFYPAIVIVGTKEK